MGYVIQEGEYCSAGKIKVGHLYVSSYSMENSHYYTEVITEGFISVGKELCHTNFVFIKVQLNKEIYANMPIDAALQSVKNNGFSIMHFFRTGAVGDNRLIDLGVLMAEEEVKRWIIQLKLTASVQLQFPNNVYYGDWVNRKKLDCVPVENLVADNVYIKEELAYLRKDIRSLADTDFVYYYVGESKFVRGSQWYVMLASYLKQFLHDYELYVEIEGVNHGLTMKQYVPCEFKTFRRPQKDMILLDKTWGLPQQRR